MLAVVVAAATVVLAGVRDGSDIGTGGSGGAGGIPGEHRDGACIVFRLPRSDPDEDTTGMMKTLATIGSMKTPTIPTPGWNF